MPGGRLAEPDVLVYLGAKVARDQIIVPNPIIICECFRRARRVST